MTRLSSIHRKKLFFGGVNLIIILFLVSCSILYPGSYSPGKNSLFSLKFNYPAEWGRLDETKRAEGTDSFYDRIIIFDPQKPSVECNYSFDCPSSPAIIFDAYRINPDGTWLIERISLARSIWEKDIHQFIISEEEVIIDGDKGIAFTIFNDYENTYRIRIYIQKNDRGYVFSIFSLPESELRGNFPRAFWEIIESIKFIIPSKE